MNFGPELFGKSTLWRTVGSVEDPTKSWLWSSPVGTVNVFDKSFRIQRNTAVGTRKRNFCGAVPFGPGELILSRNAERESQAFS